MTPSRLGLNTISLRFTTLPEVAAACAEAGFGVIEFHLDQIRGELARGLTLADCRAILADHGLRVAGGFNDPLWTLADDEAERAANHAKHRPNAELVAALGGRAMTVGTDYVAWPAADRVPDAIGRIAETVGTVAADIAPLGVDLLIEFNWGVVKTLHAAVAIARRTGLANVGVLFDPAHLHCTPTKVEHLTVETVPFIRHVHVDNMPAKPAELTDCNKDRLLPGDPAGCYDLTAIFARLEAHGYRGDYCIEMFNDALWALPPREAAKRMFDAMQTVFSPLP
jgi:2-keto-myo-inositol isomerase